MATKSAKRGFFCGVGEEVVDGITGEDASAPDGTASVFSVIRVSVEVFGERFVNHGLADHVFFAGPGAEVQQFAALAAEREVGVSARVGWLAANGTLKFHIFLRIRLPRMI